MKAISVQVDEDMYLSFKSLATKEGKDIADLIREAMADYVYAARSMGRRLVEIPPGKGRQIEGSWTRMEIFEEMID